MARSEFPTMIILWSMTLSVWTVLFTEDLAPRECDLLLVCEGVFCWVALLLDLERVLVRPLFPSLDQARDLSFHLDDGSDYLSNFVLLCFFVRVAVGVGPRTGSLLVFTSHLTRRPGDSSAPLSVFQGSQPRPASIVDP